MLTPRDASRECILSPQWGPWASGPWALGQPGKPYGSYGSHGTGKARGTPDREKPVAPPYLGGEYSREEAR